MELLRRAFEAFAECGVEGVIPFGAEDAVIYSMPEWPDDAEYHGHDGLRELTRQWEESFDDFGFDVHDLRDAGDSVVALLEMTGGSRVLVPQREQPSGRFSPTRTA